MAKNKFDTLDDILNVLAVNGAWEMVQEWIAAIRLEAEL